MSLCSVLDFRFETGAACPRLDSCEPIEIGPVSVPDSPILAQEAKPRSGEDQSLQTSGTFNHRGTEIGGQGILSAKTPRR